MKNRAQIFDTHRNLLLAIAYRMLGSAADAEDVVQDAFVRWQTTSLEEVKSPKAFLSTVVTRLCIDHKNSARIRREQYVGPWLPEPVLTDQAPEPAHAASLAESLSMAFLLLLENLSPVERAVFLLKHVFDYDYDEIAEVVGKTPVNCRQIATRAQDRVREGQPKFQVSREEQQRVAGEFVRACGSGDMDALMKVLAEEATLYADGGGKAPAFGKIHAVTRPIEGREKVARFAIAVLQQAPDGFFGRPAVLNAQQAILGFVDGRLICALLLDVADGLVQRIYIVVNPDKLAVLQRAQLSVC
jgi:RNA polymerase sigma-70 factor (ECF subfamily)